MEPEGLGLFSERKLEGLRRMFLEDFSGVGLEWYLRVNLCRALKARRKGSEFIVKMPIILEECAGD